MFYQGVKKHLEDEFPENAFRGLQLNALAAERVLGGLLLDALAAKRVFGFFFFFLLGYTRPIGLV